MIAASIRRPVAVGMAYTAVAALGVASWLNVPLEMLPDAQLPRLSVSGTWRGASPETVEAFLTAPLEAAIQQVRGVERIVSESFEEQGVGTARIDVEFQRRTDMDFVRLDLSERIASLEEELPLGVGAVNVQPYVPRELQAQNLPFLSYTFTGPYTLEALRAHVDDVIAPRVAQVDGVSLVRVYGGRDRRLEIELDPVALGALGLTPAAVRAALARLDLVGEAGIVREGDRQRTITIVNRPASAEDVRAAVLTAVGGNPVRVSDVATVFDTYEEARSLSRIDGQASVRFDVLKATGVNTVRAARRVRDRVDELALSVPFGAGFDLVDDQSEEIERQLVDLRTRALVSVVVIFLVLLAFLRSLRSAALVFATIAFSVLIALNLVYFGGLSLNLLTMMGLALGFGLVVDNSIVVLENVYRHWQRGAAGPQAAAEGAKEVVLPILASTATTLIVFVPFVYLQGELRVFYVPLAVVVALTLLASLLVAFSFVPALAARVLPPRRPATVNGEGPRQPAYVSFYAEVVSFTLRHPWLSIALTVIAFGGSYGLFDRHVSTWAMWGGGRGADTYILVQLRLPRGASLDRTDELMRFFEDRVGQIPEVERYTATVQQTSALMQITFPDSLENTQVPVAIKDEMFAYSLTFTGADVRVTGYGPSFYGGGSSPPNYAIKVLGYNYERVREIAESVGERLGRLSRVVDVDTNASGGYFERDRAMEFVAEVDRQKIAQQELTIDDLVYAINTAAGGSAALDLLKLGGEEVQILVKLEGNADVDRLALAETLVDTPSGGRIRLGDLVELRQREVLSRIRREDQQYERTVAYEFRGPTRLGDVVLDNVIASTEVPPGYSVEVTETGYMIEDEERAQIGLLLFVALLLVYMVTAALFESVRQPLCVILTVPMALIGVYLAFFYTDAAFTREAYVGVIMMLGIVVNNAILLVDHVNGVRRTMGLPLFDAVVRGTLERVRPILMTTTTTVLGLLPLVVFGGGVGSNIWDALALVLIGGLLSSTLFVLTITPTVYYLLERPRRSTAVRGAVRQTATAVPAG